MAQPRPVSYPHPMGTAPAPQHSGRPLGPAPLYYPRVPAERPGGRKKVGRHREGVARGSTAQLRSVPTRAIQEGLNWKRGAVLAAIGIGMFSLTPPATRLAVAGLNPWFVASARATGAGYLALLYLVTMGAPVPTRRQALRLAVVVIGVILGSPLFSTLALVTTTASSGSVILAVTPAVTAVCGVLRGGERRLGTWFWVASSGGLAAVLVYVVLRSAQSGESQVLADVLLVIGVVFSGVGSAEGGIVARKLGGAQTICWALVFSLPVTTPLTVSLGFVTHTVDAGADAWLGLIYTGLFSTFLGFFAWYAALAQGGIARVGQLQLLQPLLTVVWSVLLLGEMVDRLTLVLMAVILLFTLVSQRTR